MQENFSETIQWSPAPIVIDCANECYADCAKYEIEQLKAIKTTDGNVLFFGSFSNYVEPTSRLYSSLPTEWKWNIDRQGWDLYSIDINNGVFNRCQLLSIIEAVTYSGARACT